MISDFFGVLQLRRAFGGSFGWPSVIVYDLEWLEVKATRTSGGSLRNHLSERPALTTFALQKGLRFGWEFRRSQVLHQLDHLLAYREVGDAVIGADQFQRFAFGETINRSVGKLLLGPDETICGRAGWKSA